MTIEEFSRALETGEVPAEIAKLRELPEPSVVRNDDEVTSLALWPQWLSHKTQI